MVALRLFQPHKARRMYVSGRPNTVTLSQSALSVSVTDLEPTELQSVIGARWKSWICARKKVHGIVGDKDLTNNGKNNIRFLPYVVRISKNLICVN